MFKQNIKDGFEIFGPQTLNMEYLKQRYAILSKEDPDKFFVQGQQAMPMAMQQLQGKGQGGSTEGALKQGALPPVRDMAAAPQA